MTQYYDIKTYKQYDRDVKLAVRRGLDIWIMGTDASLFKLKPLVFQKLFRTFAPETI